MFTIRFSSIGFRCLFGIPAENIRNLAISAESVLGRSVLSLEEFLGEAGDEMMPSIADNFFLNLLHRRPAQANATAALRMTALIKRHRGSSGLTELASSHNFSNRQMERIFQEFVGVSPKTLVRLERLKQALALSREPAKVEWSAIAAASDYFDQSHLIREFRALTGTTPTAFTKLAFRAHEFRITAR